MKRRDLLQMAGAAAVGSAFSGQASATDSTYDVVADLGVDNTGQTAIDKKIEPYLRDGVRLEFPDGRYKMNSLVLSKVENFAMVGTGDATLVPGNYPTDGGLWFGGAFLRNITFENFTLDTRNTGPTIAFGVYDGLVVRDIEKVGAHTTTQTAFGFNIWSKSGSGLVENLTARDGDVYNDSVGANGVYSKSNGSITFRNCELSGWGDNALYASDCSGPVRVEGGYFANSNVSQVRLSSPGSYVKGATIEVDTERGGSPNMRGVRVCTGPGPVDVIDCDITMRRGQGSGAVVTAYDGGTVNIRNSRIHVDPDYTTVGSNGSRTSFGVLVDDATGVDDPGTRVIENSSITGGGHHGSAVLLRRGDTTFRNVCINQTGEGRDGITFAADSTGNAVSDSTLSVSDAPLVRNGASVSTSNLSFGGQCPLPTGVTYDQYTAADVSLADVPIPNNASRAKRPRMGTSDENPTAIIYGRYDDPGMRSFVAGNLQKIVRDFVSTGAMNIEFRMLPGTADEDYLTGVGLATWDLEPANYWGFFDHVLTHDDLSYGSPGEVSPILQASGVRNYGWIPWLSDDYQHLIDADEAAADEYGLTAWSDFPPIIEFKGELAAPQYGYEGGIKNWLQNRL